MAAVKAYFYKLREDLPDVCEGVDIPRYVKQLSTHFRRAAKSLEDVDPKTPLPWGAVYYSDTPRDCFESPSLKKYDLEDAISDCIRLADQRDAAEKQKGKRSHKKGSEKRALAKVIARKIVEDSTFREKLLAYNRVPQAWSEFLQPVNPEQALNKRELMERLVALDDRDFSHPTNAKGVRHPLARIMESMHFTDKEKLNFIADYMIGRRKNEASRAVRIGGRGNYQEFNRAHWLEQNNAFVLETVGDVLELKSHFTKTNRLTKGSIPSLTQLEAGDLKLEP